MTSYYILIAILMAGSTGAYLANKLTFAASVGGALIGLVLFLGIGWSGILLMAVFFLVGTTATAWKRRYKESLVIAEANQGQRQLSQVLANAGAAALIAVYCMKAPGQIATCSLLVAACFSSATADTLSSELGSVYGSRFYNIVSWKKDQRGLDGVISFEGTAIGLMGSLIIGLVYCFLTRWSMGTVLIIAIAGTTGNLADSLLGATVERRGILGNDLVNFLNTVIAALAALMLDNI